MSINEHIQKVVDAAMEAVKRHGNFHRKPDKRDDGMIVFFFENHDDERMNFYWELHNIGFHDVYYRAPYSWKVTNEAVTVTYVEGDVYVTAFVKSDDKD